MWWCVSFERYSQRKKTSSKQFEIVSLCFKENTMSNLQKRFLLYNVLVICCVELTWSNIRRKQAESSFLTTAATHSLLLNTVALLGPCCGLLEKLWFNTCDFLGEFDLIQFDKITVQCAFERDLTLFTYPMFNFFQHVNV